MLHKMENMVMNNSAYKQIHLYSIPPSNISTRVDTICISCMLMLMLRLLLAFITVLRKSMPMCHLP